MDKLKTKKTEAIAKREGQYFKFVDISIFLAQVCGAKLEPEDVADILKQFLMKNMNTFPAKNTGFYWNPPLLLAKKDSITKYFSMIKPGDKAWRELHDATQYMRVKNSAGFLNSQSGKINEQFNCPKCQGSRVTETMNGRRPCFDCNRHGQITLNFDIARLKNIYIEKEPFYEFLSEWFLSEKKGKKRTKHEIEFDLPTCFIAALLRVLINNYASDKPRLKKETSLNFSQIHERLKKDIKNLPSYFPKDLSLIYKCHTHEEFSQFKFKTGSESLKKIIPKIFNEWVKSINDSNDAAVDSVKRQVVNAVRELLPEQPDENFKKLESFLAEIPINS